MDSAGRYIGQAVSELGIDDSVLLGRVFVIGGGQLWDDCNHAAGDLELNLVARLESGPPPHLIRHGDGGFAFDVTVLTGLGCRLRLGVALLDLRFSRYEGSFAGARTPMTFLPS
jgi:hypothetical protein